MSIEELNEVKAENSGITLHSHLLAGVCNEITINHVQYLQEIQKLMLMTKMN